MINSHIHLFRDIDIPNRFLPLNLVRILRSKIINKFFRKLLCNIIPFTDKDSLNKYAKFIEIGGIGSQEKIFKECERCYPKETRFIVLPMDMAFMGAGDVPRDYKCQLIELYTLSLKYKNLIPFIHIDPRRKNYYELLVESVEKWGFKGVKLYCSLGYFPTDSRLLKVYEYCEQNKLPIIAHCSPSNPVHFKGSNEELKELLKTEYPNINMNQSRKELTALFGEPKNYEKILTQYPNLNICLAHFGSESEWVNYLEGEDEESTNWHCIIKELIYKYSNLYTDISFTLENKELSFSLNSYLEDDLLKNKILFGTDYYMVETETNEAKFLIGLMNIIGKEKFKMISETNTKKFLYEK